MRTLNKQLITVLALAFLALYLFSGNVLADAETPGDPSEAVVPNGTAQESSGSMMDWMGQEAWGEMIQHMTQVHGPELTGQMIQWMNSEDMPCDEAGGPGHMMGNGFGGMMGWRFNGNSGGRSMMGNFFGR
jgi:hypothetical protein